MCACTLPASLCLFCWLRTSLLSTLHERSSRHSFTYSHTQTAREDVSYFIFLLTNCLPNKKKNTRKKNLRCDCEWEMGRLISNCRQLWAKPGNLEKKNAKKKKRFIAPSRLSAEDEGMFGNMRWADGGETAVASLVVVSDLLSSQ